MPARDRTSDPEPPPEPLVSACLIVRNEAEMLPACLESLSGLADEVVVVDTGSTDGTQEIARGAGATVHSHAWRDDFAAARNAALDHAHGRWILQIDADERLAGPGGAPPDRAAIRDGLASPPAGLAACDAWVLRVRNLGPGTRWSDVGTAPRLFARRSGLRYRRRIHETLERSDAAPRCGLLEDLELLHLGYLPEVQTARNKADRNRRLSALALADDPEDPELQYYYGLELARVGRTAEALVYMRRAWDGLPAAAVGSALWHVVVVRTCEVMTRSGCAAEALARLEPLVAALPGVAHLHFLRGEALRKLGRAEEALSCLGAALCLPPAPVAWESSETRCCIWNAIGLIHEQSGAPAQAVEAYRQSLAFGSTECARTRLAALEPRLATYTFVVENGQTAARRA